LAVFVMLTGAAVAASVPAWADGAAARNRIADVAAKLFNGWFMVRSSWFLQTRLLKKVQPYSQKYRALEWRRSAGSSFGLIDEVAGANAHAGTRGSNFDRAAFMCGGNLSGFSRARSELRWPSSAR
jgi:hypothetical protein